jgi:hypothetical protein
MCWVLYLAGLHVQSLIPRQDCTCRVLYVASIASVESCTGWVSLVQSLIPGRDEMCWVRTVPGGDWMCWVLYMTGLHVQSLVPWQDCICRVLYVARVASVESCTGWVSLVQSLVPGRDWMCWVYTVPGGDWMCWVLYLARFACAESCTLTGLHMQDLVCGKNCKSRVLHRVSTAHAESCTWQGLNGLGLVPGGDLTCRLTTIDGLVCLVRFQTVNFRLFLCKQTDKLSFAWWANAKHIKENCLGFRFLFDMAAYIQWARNL